MEKKIPTNEDIVNFFKKYGLWFVIFFVVINLLSRVVFTKINETVTYGGETYRVYQTLNHKNILLLKKGYGLW